MSESKNNITKYLTPQLEDYMFDELSLTYLERAGLKDLLKGVPVPFKKQDLAKPETSSLAIAGNMAFVIGCDPDFKYADAYLKYIHKQFGSDFAKPMVNAGIEATNSEDYIRGCTFFRAAKQIDPELKEAAFYYGKACHDIYENADDATTDSEYVGNFKAEYITAFERLTIDYPDFAPGFYYLGYAYLNLGLYIKAKLTFREFIKYTDDAELRAEVAKLDEKLCDPCKIEEGYNAILSGRFEAGIDILSTYEDDNRFNTWWPLWYYLSIAYRAIDEPAQAIDHMLKVLNYSPSNIDAMQALVEMYEEMGDNEKVKKYSDKINLIKANAEMDREMLRNEKGIEVS